MFWIAEQIVDFIYNGKLTFLLLVWTLGVVNYSIFTYYFTKYKPYKNNFRVPVSVIVSVFREKQDIFIKCLSSIKEQLKEKDEFFIVFDGEDISLQRIAEQYGTVVIKTHGGKRSTLSYGCDNAHNSILVTIDSDTILCPDCLDKIVMPFKDNKIGAVSAYQRIFNSNQNLASKFADYNEIMSHDFIQKATSSAGNVAVLFGRCLAIRSVVWNKISYKYQNRMFRGRKVESGDDNDITLLTIHEGYNTFMQSTARVTSDCPRDFWKRLKQQYRFNRSSVRVTIMDWISQPRLILQAKLGFLNQIDAVIFPVLVLIVWIEWVNNILYGSIDSTLINLTTPMLVIATTITLFTTLTLQHLPLLERKRDLGVWLIYVFYSWFIMNILHVIAILTIYKEDAQMIQYSRNE